MTIMEPLYDLSFIAGIANDNDDFIKNLLEVFIETAPKDANTLLTQLEAGDFAGVGRTAHKVKSTVDTLQIHQLTQPIRTLEMLGKSGDASYQSMFVLTQEVVEKLQAAVAQAKQDPLFAN